MRLDPSRYHCGQHDNVDYLTAAVRAAVETSVVITEEVPAEDMSNLSGRTSQGTFKVIVDCPGNAVDAKAHPLTFRGLVHD